MIYKLKFKNNKGFTLIELLISIAIGMLVVGFGSVALNNFNEQQKINTTSQELLSELRLARNYAVTDQLNGGNRTVVEINSNGLMTVDSYNNDAFVKSFLSKDLTPDNIFIKIDKQIKFTVTDGRSINGAINIGVSGNVVKNIKIDESGLIYEE